MKKAVNIRVNKQVWCVLKWMAKAAACMAALFAMWLFLWTGYILGFTM